MKDVSPIPKTKRAAKPKTKPQEEIPQDLSDKWGAIVAIATAHKLLQEGLFTYAHRNAVGVSLAFLEELHFEALKSAKKHPKSDLIPDIQKQLSARMETNGKTEN